MRERERERSLKYTLRSLKDYCVSKILYEGRIMVEYKSKYIAIQCDILFEIDLCLTDAPLIHNISNLFSVMGTKMYF